LREICKKEIEKSEEGEIVLRIDDVCYEAVELFVNYLYTGSMNDESRVEGDNDHTWVKMLPQLVCMARKVNDLSPQQI